MWSPCIGPTLGVAIGLATHSSTFLDAMQLMFFFSLGAIIPLMFVSYGSRKLFLEKRNSIISIGQKSKIVMGVILLLIAFGIIFGYDKKIEALMLTQLPEIWLELLTKF